MEANFCVWPWDPSSQTQSECRNYFWKPQSNPDLILTLLCLTEILGRHLAAFSAYVCEEPFKLFASAVILEIEMRWGVAYEEEGTKRLGYEDKQKGMAALQRIMLLLKAGNKMSFWMCFCELLTLFSASMLFRPIICMELRIRMACEEWGMALPESPRKAFAVPAVAALPAALYNDNWQKRLWVIS